MDLSFGSQPSSKRPPSKSKRRLYWRPSSIKDLRAVFIEPLESIGRAFIGSGAPCSLMACSRSAPQAGLTGVAVGSGPKAAFPGGADA
jgi:hypothetical protein